MRGKEISDMAFRTEPNIFFIGNDNFPYQRCEKVCIDYASQKVRMSLVLHERLMTHGSVITDGNSRLTKPKEHRKVIYLPMDSNLLIENG